MLNVRASILVSENGWEEQTRLGVHFLVVEIRKRNFTEYPNQNHVLLVKEL